MKTAFKFKEYIWLVETIHRAKRITFSDIQEKWLRSSLSEGGEGAGWTWNRHRGDVGGVWGVNITGETKKGNK